MKKDNYVVLTGAPGSGKSTLLSLLRERGYICIDEPARKIIAEQRSIAGQGVSDKDPNLFIELMLSRSISLYESVSDLSVPVFFDRGIADNIAYAKLFDIPFNHGWKAAQRYRVNTRVFFTPNWEEIYVTDKERVMSYEASAAMGDDIRRIYKELGYTLVDLPLDTPEQRLSFVLEQLS